ncbi:MAG TPA: hypothetical protein PKW55_03735 [Spirochaetota bacterium]|nr:hypothetical protein [Spirochaetota bacterium]
MKKKIILCLFIIFTISCSSSKSADNFQLDTSFDQTNIGFYFGDNVSGGIDISSTIDTNILASGLPGFFNISGIGGIKGYNGWNSYKTFAFVEKDRHTAWLFYNVLGNWYLMKIGGTPDIGSDGIVGLSSWMREPYDIEKMGTISLSDSYGDYTADFLYITDSGNSKIKMFLITLYTSGVFTGYKVSTPFNYCQFSAEDNPVSITRDGDTLANKLYVTTKNGKIYKITPTYPYTTGTSTLIKTVTLNTGEYLHGITYNTSNSRLYYIKGNTIGWVTTDGSSSGVVNLDETTAKNIFESSDASYFKDIDFYNDALYITDTYKHVIYKVYNLSSSPSTIEIFAGKETESGDMIGNRLTDARFNAPFGISVDTGNNVMYITDNINNNIKYAETTDINTISKIPVETTSPAFLFEPRGLTVSPNGRFVYIADSSNYKVKKIDNETGNTSILPIGSYLWAIWDVKVIREQNQYETRDRFLLLLETNKQTYQGRVSVYDLVKGGYKVLYGPIVDLGKFMGSMTLNERATVLYVTSRHLNEGVIYRMPLKYEDDTIKANYSDTSNPPIFLRKTGYFPLGITYYRDPSDGSEFLLTTAVHTGSSVLDVTKWSVSRFQISGTARSDIIPNIVKIDWDFLGPYDLYYSSTPISYPRFITNCGKYAYFTDEYATKVYRIDITGSAGQTPIVSSIKYYGTSVMPFGIAVDGVSKKIYISVPSTNMVYRYDF